VGLWYERAVGALFPWFRENWFPLLQTIGIIGGLLFTGISIRQATKARKATDLLALTEQHRDLWDDVYTRPGLSRILAESADLVAQPVTLAERWFLNEVIVHFQTGWQLSRCGSMITKDAIEADVRAFFKLPVPHWVWKQTKAARDPKFVQFVEGCLQ
jgi:hypothetical protein